MADEVEGGMAIILSKALELRQERGIGSSERHRRIAPKIDRGSRIRIRVRSPDEQYLTCAGNNEKYFNN